MSIIMGSTECYWKLHSDKELEKNCKENKISTETLDRIYLGKDGEEDSSKKIYQ